MSSIVIITAILTKNVQMFIYSDDSLINIYMCENKRKC